MSPWVPDLRSRALARPGHASMSAVRLKRPAWAWRARILASVGVMACAFAHPTWLVRDMQALSIHLRARRLDDRRPLRLLAVDVGGVFLGRRRQRFGAIIGEARSQLVGGHRGAQRRAEFID